MAKSTNLQKEPFPFLKLPSELQLKVFDRLSYDDISRCRLVSKALDNLCQQVLNAGFHRVERFHARTLQRVKSQLPRRESERRTHELARHSDILTSIETRLSLLSMTYGKYVDNSLCCFIPGKVLDEMFRVLRIVNKTPRGDQAPRPHELLQELRDISSMAMEHFEEHIVPSLKDRINMSPSAANNAAAAALSTSALVFYAAATASPPLLGVPGFATMPKTASCGLRHQYTASACNRSGFHPLQPSPVDIQNGQNLRYSNLKRQCNSQSQELSIYKRELSKLRATQQRQKEKLNDMERRLNEQEQRFIDLFAQLRNNGLAPINGGNGSGMIGDGGNGNSAAGNSAGNGNLRKRSSQNMSTSSKSESTIVSRAAKRPKMNERMSQ